MPPRTTFCLLITDDASIHLQLVYTIREKVATLFPILPQRDLRASMDDLRLYDVAIFQDLVAAMGNYDPHLSAGKVKSVINQNSAP